MIIIVYRHGTSVFTDREESEAILPLVPTVDLKGEQGSSFTISKLKVKNGKNRMLLLLFFFWKGEKIFSEIIFDVLSP